MTRSIVDLCGQKFGLLTVIEYAGLDKHGKHRWICACSCGGSNSIKNIEQGKLFRKDSTPTRSCGCLVKKHGHTVGGNVSPTFKSWDSMLSRCYSKQNKNYAHYGARGIGVCDCWNPSAGGSFANFLEDMGERVRGQSIERIDCNGNYEPDNCKWATSKEQASNKRNSRKITFNGKTQSIMEWAEETGIPYSTLAKRIYTYNWNHERALTTPNTSKPQQKSTDVLIEYNGDKLCLEEWGRRYRISSATIRNRLRAGWTPEAAITTPPQR